MIIVIGRVGYGIYEHEDVVSFDDVESAVQWMETYYPDRLDGFVMLTTTVDHGYRFIEEVPRGEWFD